MSSFAVVARWVGFCQPCARERPLVLTAFGPHGFRAWLAGYGPEDRELAYCCGVCGAREHVPATQHLDDLYDATLPRWPDLDLPGRIAEPVAVEVAVDAVAQTSPSVAVPADAVLSADAALPVDVLGVDVASDVWELAARRLLARAAPRVEARVPSRAMARRAAVWTSVVPVQRVDVTDLLDLLALSA